jgi:hypothetical protein
MTPLRHQMHDAMLVRSFAQRTRQAYLEVVAKLAAFYHQSPAELAPEQVEAWLLHLVCDRKLSYSTVNQAASACRFLYGTVLKREAVAFPVPITRVPHWQPCLPASLLSNPEPCYEPPMRQDCGYRRYAPCGSPTRFGPTGAAAYCGTTGWSTPRPRSAVPLRYSTTCPAIPIAPPFPTSAS